MRCLYTNTIMRSVEDKRDLAPFVLDACAMLGDARPDACDILLIPFKSLATAKQRLAAALDQPQRSQLAEAMLRDVMTAAAGVSNQIDVALVTGDARAQAMAGEFGFLVIEDAATRARPRRSRWRPRGAKQRGYDTTIVVPATFR